MAKVQEHLSVFWAFLLVVFMVAVVLLMGNAGGFSAYIGGPVIYDVKLAAVTPLEQTVSPGTEDVTAGVWKISTRESVKLDRIVFYYSGSEAAKEVLSDGKLYINGDLIGTSVVDGKNVSFNSNYVIPAGESREMSLVVDVRDESPDEDFRYTVRYIGAKSVNSGDAVKGKYATSKLYANYVHVVKMPYLFVSKASGSAISLENGDEQNILDFDLSAINGDVNVSGVKICVEKNSSFDFENPFYVQLSTGAVMPVVTVSVDPACYSPDISMTVLEGETESISFKADINNFSAGDFLNATLDFVNAQSNETGDNVEVVGLPVSSEFTL